MLDTNISVGKLGSLSPALVSTHVTPVLLFFCLLLPIQFRKRRGIPQRNAPPRSQPLILAPRREHSRPARLPLVQMW